MQKKSKLELLSMHVEKVRGNHKEVIRLWGTIFTRRLSGPPTISKRTEAIYCFRQQNPCRASDNRHPVWESLSLP